MSANRISITVTTEQRQGALDGVAAIRAAVPGLIALNPGEGRELYHFVNRNELFGRGVLSALEAHPQIVPEERPQGKRLDNRRSTRPSHSNRRQRLTVEYWTLFSFTTRSR